MSDKTITIERKHGEPLTIYRGDAIMLLGLYVRGGNMSIHLLPDEARELASALIETADRMALTPAQVTEAV